MFASKRFNKGYLLVLVALLVLFWLPILWLPAGGASPSGLAESGQSIPVVGVLYYLSVSVLAIFLSLFALIYAPIGIVRNAGSRMLHLGQFIAAFVLLAPLTVAIFLASVFWGGGPG